VEAVIRWDVPAGDVPAADLAPPPDSAPAADLAPPPDSAPAPTAS